MTTHTSWLELTIGGDSKTTAAKKAGIPASTLLTQARHGHLSVDTVLAIARAYGRAPVAALVETGFLSVEEAAADTFSMAEVALALRAASDRKLLQEVMRRIRSEPKSWGFKVGEEPEFDSNGNVTEIRPARHDGLPAGAVADGSPDHAEENSDFDD